MLLVPSKALWTAIVIALNMLGCAHMSARADAVGCRADRECHSGFCDRGQCAQPEGKFGAMCTPAPHTADGFRDAKLHSCGAYFCSDSRCRSCELDSQCQAELGAMRCLSSPGRPGLRCGR